MKRCLLAVTVIAMFSVSAFAAFTPLKLSVWGKKIALPPVGDVYGVELGLASYSPVLKGIQYNILFSKSDNMIGLQTAFVTRSRKFIGLQMGISNLTNHDGDFSGMQIGAVNRAKFFRGLQIGVIFNKVAEEMNGVQIGLINSATVFRGLQIGLINTARDAKGVQLGLINIMRNSYVPVMVILNVKFEI
ncbi:MAG: hypothetical protein LBD46_08280 [Endomicrobium sp.]|jgi:hypothetical protein|nr:hypothetical protein [Endomicrobium sp.]